MLTSVLYLHHQKRGDENNEKDSCLDGNRCRRFGVSRSYLYKRYQGRVPYLRWTSGIHRYSSQGHLERCRYLLPLPVRQAHPALLRPGDQGTVSTRKSASFISGCLSALNSVFNLAKLCAEACSSAKSARAAPARAAEKKCKFSA